MATELKVSINNSSLLIGYIFAAFLLFITLRGELAAYIMLFRGVKPESQGVGGVSNEPPLWSLQGVIKATGKVLDKVLPPLGGGEVSGSGDGVIEEFFQRFMGNCHLATEIEYNRPY
jgi:hypothetical protein